MNLSSSSKKGDQHPPLNKPSAANHEEAVGKLYDRLLNGEREKLATKNLTIHKRLHFPQSDQANGIVDSNDWLKSNLQLAPNAHILDAGCGVGGTLFSLLGENRTGVGISLSGTQVRAAQKIAEQRSQTTRCHFLQQSYDEPLQDSFDLIISIEALTHSHSLATSIKNLAAHLNPDGQFIIIEDMAVKDISNQPLANIWQQSWCLNSIYTRQDYANALEASRLSLIREVDFTPYIHTKPWPNWLIQLGWWLWGKRPLTSKRPLNNQSSKDIFIGGWALEKLYRLNLINYRVFIAKG